MACNLKKDPQDRFDALTISGLTATVFIKSNDAPTASVTAASLNGVDVPVGADGKMKLPAFQKGTNILNFTIEGAEAGDDIQLVEDCGNGQSLSLKTKLLGAAPGGADPVVGFRIHAS